MILTGPGISHGDELLEILNTAHLHDLPAEVLQVARALEGIQDDSAEATGALTAVQQVEALRIEQNQRLTDELLGLELFPELSVADALRLIVNVQARHALLNGKEPVSGRLLRTGKYAYYPEGDILPRVAAQHVGASLNLLVAELDREFDGLSPEEAIVKACFYFNLSMLLHAQEDFNTRINKSFFDYLIARASRPVSGKQTKRVFRNAGPHFKRSHLFPADINLKAQIFARHFPELSENPKFPSFINALFTKLFSHNRTLADLYNLGYDDAGMIFSESWTICEPEGLTREDFDTAYSKLDVGEALDKETIYSRAVAMANLDSQEGYFQEALESSKDLMQLSLDETLPVLREMQRRNLPFTTYNYYEVFRVLNGTDQRSNQKISKFLPVILWAMEQIRAVEEENSKPKEINAQ